MSQYNLKQLFGLITIASIISCTTSEKPNIDEELSIQGEAQGTTYTVKYIGQRIEQLPQQLDSLLLSIDRSLSTYDSSSLISAFNRGDTIVPDEMFKEMVDHSRSIHKETKGAFDPTIGPLIRAWGWGFSKAEEMDSAKVDSLLQIRGFEKVQLEDGLAYLTDTRAALNFNAIAQGYSVDLMADFLERYEIHNYYVELGGEIKVKGVKQDSSFWRIGIDKPEEGNESRDLIAILELENKAMATSGNYRKFYEKDGKKYSHTIDPNTGYPVQHNLLSATVISDNCYRADALATAFMVMGLESAVEVLESNSVDQAFLVYTNEDGSYGYYISEGLKENLRREEVN